MIRGSVTAVGPTVSAYVIIYFTNSIGSRSSLSWDIPFLVDTGSARTILSRADCERRLGLPVSLLPTAPPLSGLGGEASTRYAEGAIGFLHEDQRLSVFSITFGVVDIPFSVLGHDVLRMGKLTVDFPNAEMSLELPTI